jgi:hypothetical protein
MFAQLKTMPRDVDDDGTVTEHLGQVQNKGEGGL